MLVKIAIVLAVLFAVLAVVVQMRSGDFRIERSAAIGAPPETAYALINDMHAFTKWSPFEKLDPDMKKTFEGPQSGVGAAMGWSGNGKAGEGKMTITESKPGQLVAMRLQFVRPFACDNKVQFKIEPAPGGSRVTWVMDGKNGFVSKAFCMVMDMDKMVGKDFEEGLANLDRLARVEVGKTVPQTQPVATIAVP